MQLFKLFYVQLAYAPVLDIIAFFPKWLKKDGNISRFSFTHSREPKWPKSKEISNGNINLVMLISVKFESFLWYLEQVSRWYFSWFVVLWLHGNVARTYAFGSWDPALNIIIVEFWFLILSALVGNPSLAATLGNACKHTTGCHKTCEWN